VPVTDHPIPGNRIGRRHLNPKNPKPPTRNATPLSILNTFGTNSPFIVTLSRQKIKKEGNGSVPFFISPMTSFMDTPLQAVEQMVKALLEDDPAYFLVDMRIKPTNNVKVYLDGDQGITIEKCIAINRALYKKIEEAGLFPNGDFSLEVSSPGLDEPLKLFRQYKKNVGRPVEVILKDGIKVTGKMVEVQDDSILVEETKGKNKKMEVIKHHFPFENIKSTKIQAAF